MNKRKLFIYLLVAVFLIAGIVLIINNILKDLEKKEALKQTRHYLAQNYPNMEYNLLEISSSTHFKHYGYFEHAVTVQNINREETLTVYYDKKMNRMEDSINIESQEELLNQEVNPKIERYIEDHFGETKYISVSYNVEKGKPLIVVTFKKNHQDITQTDFDTFISFLKDTIELEHATVIVDYWTRELSFNQEF
ncbi:hypothetical protein SAMN05880501_104188 [Ureibacillus xyleni]|uniref:Uncharacterized protein n=1 Tax=Ureibacillus xyleni TaxID=614648 RepID=A0A285SE13_9BACL|nr:hypothetical protein [Ureibacillus xyleni]SOC06105.1 hypothetical protein SAMN05880501_104188 [Ureibacillus xyleni]